MKIGVHYTLTYYPDYDQFPIAVTITLPIILLALLIMIIALSIIVKLKGVSLITYC